MTSHSPLAPSIHSSAPPPAKSHRHPEKEILDSLLILGQRNATTDKELIQYAWYFSDMIIVWDDNQLTFMCGFIYKGYC